MIFCIVILCVNGSAIHQFAKGEKKLFLRDINKEQFVMYTLCRQLKRDPYKSHERLD